MYNNLDQTINPHVY